MESPEVLAALGRRLKAARTLAGMKVRDYARELGISEARVYRIESGNFEPTALELAAIIELTGQPYEFFFAASSDGASILSQPAEPVEAK